MKFGIQGSTVKAVKKISFFIILVKYNPYFT